MVPSLITVYEFTIKSVYTIEMILCHCHSNQQCGQVSDWEKPDIFPDKANACRTEDKTSKRRTSPPFAGRLVTLPVSVSPSVCRSVTSRCSTKTAKRRMTQTTAHETPGSLVFWCQRSVRNSTGVTPYGGAKCRWVVKMGDFRQITRYISKTVKDRHIVSIKVE